MKLYLYRKCSSCLKAKKWLDSKNIFYEEKAIVETPPTIEELRNMLVFYDGNIRKLFNTSGMEYRSRNLKEHLPAMSEEDALALLSENGMLVKRPFLISDTTTLVGYNEDVWREAIESSL